MVVVSGSWGKNAATYPTLTSNDMVITDSNKMSAKAILVCRPNSHVFQERTLCLDQPVKVGRSVARTKATPTNATFDCKVLSRNHALLWYENGKFFLQDTKSSNGTYVNNNRLSSNESEPHEVSSGDIVQFGVDVVENNRKVTHGCIIAMLKLYLPDGKEAKASPGITEGHKHGYVPLDELYKLNQVLQEASQRELYLETKLNALQQVVSEARKSADESWQAYVGEERLLSRVAVLERQLMQAGKGWSDEKLKEELDKLQEERCSYETAAKEALKKLHDERLEAIAAAADEQRSRAAAEQECVLVKEQLSQAQTEIQVIAQKMSEEQKKMNEEKIQYEQRERDLRTRLDIECVKLNDIQSKLDQLKCAGINSNCNIFEDDENRKEEMLEENDMEDTNKTNGTDDNHICFTVARVETVVSQDNSESETDSNVTQGVLSYSSDNTTASDYDGEEFEDQEKCNRECQEITTEPIHVDSRTLKYQFQSAQNEFKKQIEKLEIANESNQYKIKELENALLLEKQQILMKDEENLLLKEEMLDLEQKLKEYCNESQQLRDKLSCTEQNSVSERSSSPVSNSLINGVNLEQFSALEEELVFIKERYAKLNEEKIVLKSEMHSLQERYSSVCNKSYNQMFFYVVPLVLMVLYLLISNMFS